MVGACSAVEQQGLKAELAFIPKETALASLKERTGMTDALAALGCNPLPDGYVLTINNLDQIADATRIET